MIWMEEDWKILQERKRSEQVFVVVALHIIAFDPIQCGQLMEMV